MDYILVILIGLCIGSFLNVCIYRIPEEQSIAFPPSHCMTCGYKLKTKDLVPIFSYIFLKGRCRGCGEKISIQYPIIEFFNGLIYLLIYMQNGYSIKTLEFMIFSSLMIVIAMIDFKTKFVYTSTIIFGFLVELIFFIIQWINTNKFPKDRLIGMIIGVVCIGLIVVITRGMGEGDIEIAGISGLLLGSKAMIFMLFSSIIMGGFVAFMYIIIKKKGKKYEMAFGPCLAIGTILSMFIGNQVIIAYVNYL